MAKDNGFEQRIRFVTLYEMYGALLTKKQRACLELYFCEDLSLGEIADELSVSRQAIHDLLKRVEQTLEHYEEILGFLQMKEANEVFVQEAQDLLKEAQKTKSTKDLAKVQKILSRLSIESR